MPLLLVTFWGFLVFTKSINSGEDWKIVISGIGFSIMLIMTIYLFIRFKLG